ncbi:MAG: hypothetical protein JW881_07735 [Spirochaetales bacterium]|nr:hypothetical protein [Spirochaetales bacterium]
MRNNIVTCITFLIMLLIITNCSGSITIDVILSDNIVKNWIETYKAIKKDFPNDFIIKENNNELDYSATIIFAGDEYIQIIKKYRKEIDEVLRM